MAGVVHGKRKACGMRAGHDGVVRKRRNVKESARRILQCFSGIQGEVKVEEGLEGARASAGKDAQISAYAQK